MSPSRFHRTGPGSVGVIGVVVTLAAVISAAGALAVTEYARRSRTAMADLLATAVEAKVSAYTWQLGERFADARLVASQLETRRSVSGDDGAAVAARRHLQSELQALVVNYQYQRAVLYDTLLQTVASVRPLEPSAVTRAAAAQALASREPVLVPFHPNTAGDWEWGVVAPVFRDGPDTALVQPAGVLLLTRSGRLRLFPTLEDLGTRSTSYEGVLLQREGDSLAVIATSRLTEVGVERGRRISGGRGSLAGQAALAIGQMVAGTDYRGVEAVGSGRPVPGTPWLVVAKIDRAEADAPIRLFAWAVTGVALLAIALLGGLGRIVWLRRQREFEREQAALALRAAHVVDATTDGYVVLDGTGRLLEVNEPLCRMTGYSAAELTAMRLTDVELALSSDQIAEALERIRASGAARFQTRWRTRAGTALDLDVSTTFYRSARGEFFVGFLRDISTELASRGRLQRINRLYAFLNQTSEALFGIVDADAAYQTVCELAVREAGFPLAWIGAMDPAAGMVRPVAMAGAASAYARGLRITLDPALATSRGPASRAVREGAPIAINDFLTNPETTAWRSAALEYGLASAVAFPIVVGGAPVGTVVFYDTVAEAFDAESVTLLAEVARLLSLVLQSVEITRARAVETARREQSEQLFRDLFEASPVPSVVIHRDRLDITRLNRAFREAFGYRLEDVPTVHRLVERLFPDEAERARLLGKFRDDVVALAPGQTLRSGDLVVHDASGQVRDVQGFAARIGEEVVISWVDLTELRASQMIAREAQKLARLSGWRYDFATQVMTRSEDYADVLELREAVTSGESTRLFSLARADTADALRAEFFRAAETGTPFSEISPVALRDGTTRWFRLEARFERDAAGRPLQALGTTQDITAQHEARLELERYRAHLEELVTARTGELKRANAALTTADRRLTAMLQLSQRASRLTEEEVLQFAIDQSVWLTGSRGGYLLVLGADGTWTEGGYWAVGTTAEPGALGEGPVLLGETGVWHEAVATRRHVLLNEAPPETMPPPLTASGVAFARHLVIPVLEGEAVRLLIGVGDKPTPYDSGDVHELQLIARDIWTIVQRRRAELELQRALERLRISDERFAFAMEASHEGVWDWDLESGIVTVNQVFATMFGRAPDALAPTAAAILAMLHPDDRDRTIGLMREAFLAASVVTTEFRMRHADGSWRWVMLRGKAVTTDATGRPTRAVGTITDLTARKQAEDELRTAKEQADAANRAKSSFLAVMSHEIRTPLNGVVGMAEVLAESALPPREMEAVRTIRSSATSLLGLIDDILDFSKIEAGRLELDLVETDLPAVAEVVCGALAPVAAAKHVELSLFIDPRLPVRVRTDGTRIRQILYNLVGNAVKFSANQSDRVGRVGVRLAPVPGEPLRVALVVRDNGIGMTAEAVGRLFTSFSQGETSTTRRFGGTGLGLAITKRLVDLFGGTIQVESAPGVGSTFRVELPIVALVPQPAAPPRELLGVTVVVVQNTEEPQDADDHATLLRAAGAEVVVAADTRAALAEAARRAPPLVVVTDAEGIEAAADGAGLPVRVVRIAHGRRHAPRVVSPVLVTLDRTSVRAATLCRAVAIAAGRASPDAAPGPGDGPVVTPGMHAPTVEEARRAGRLILIAEDDEVNQRVILRQLELLGYAAEVAADGQRALAMWRSGRYALLLTDLHMPEMDGYTLTTTIRGEEPAGSRLPIIALTANALRGEEVRARAAGLDAYLTKPVRLKDLRDALETWMPKPAASPEVVQPDTGEDTTPAVLDLAVLRSLVGDDDAVVAAMLDEYRASARQLVPEVETAIAEGALATVGTLAHRLKSSSRSIGAMQFAEECALLEAAAKSGAATGVAALGPAFTAAWLALRDALTPTAGAS